MLAGAAAGAIVAAVVSLGGSTGQLVAGAIAMLLLPILSLDVIGIRIHLVQRNTETPKRWIDEGRYHWAFKNGAALGFGGSTRLGFWSWYLIPIAAGAAGSTPAGAMIWGGYAFVRTATSIAFGRGRFGGVTPRFLLPRQLLNGRGFATRASDLIGVAVAAIIVVGTIDAL